MREPRTLINDANGVQRGQGADGARVRHLVVLQLAAGQAASLPGAAEGEAVARPRRGVTPRRP